jgi:hypothetical protein
LLKAGAGCFLGELKAERLFRGLQIQKLKEVTYSVGAVCRGGLSLRKAESTLT